MHELARLRRAQQLARNRFDGKAPLRPVLTGHARAGYSASDLESLETVTLPGQNANGSFPFLPGYDDIDELLP